MMKKKISSRIMFSSVSIITGLAMLCGAVGMSLANPVPASAGAGAIWTTRGDCINPQDAMEYAVGEWVQLNGDGWDPGVDVDWYIQGTGGSCKPYIFHSGTVTPDGNGEFCFQMYQGQSDDCGPYQVKARQYDDPYSSGDNFEIVGPEEAVTIGDYVWSDLDSNGIQDDGATGIAGVPVTLQVWEQQGGGSWDFAASTTTNGSGYYQFVTIPGNYRVVFPTSLAGHTGLTTPNAGGDTIDSDADQSTGATHDITLANGESDLSLDAGYVPEFTPQPSINVLKAATPDTIPETGGDVTFDFVVENTGNVDLTLTSLIDTIFGDLNGQGDCSVPQSLPVFGSYSCNFTLWLSGSPSTPHVNVVTGTAVDAAGAPVQDTAEATVTFSAIPPVIRLTKSASPSAVPETGGDVTFTFLVENIGEEDVTLNSLTDTVFGDLNGLGDCSVPQSIPIGGSYSCTYTVFLSGDELDPHYDVATAVAEDDDGTQAQDTDDETVAFLGVLPAIILTKTADDDLVPETGQDVTFTFLVENPGPWDVTLISLTDNVFGDLDGQGDCLMTQPIPVGGSYSCSATFFMQSDSMLPHNNVATATAVDDEGTEATWSDDASLAYEDVLPDVGITKVADPTSVAETGENVDFTITVTNNSLEPVQIMSLVDTDFDLAAHCPDAVGTWLNYLETYTCTFTELISGDASGPDHEDTATVVAEDNEGNQDIEEDSATVGFTDVAPTILVYKDADPTSVPESGDNVTFDVMVSNESEEDLTLDSLTDDVFGDITTSGHDGIVSTTCATGGTIPVGDSYSCEFTALVSGAPGTHTNVVTAIASDNEGTPAQDDDPAEVSITDIPVDISVLKEADPTTVPETGGDVTFTVTVTNHNAEDVTLDSLTDDVFGDLNGQGDCAVPQTLLASGGTYTCSFLIAGLSGSASGPEPWHENEVTAVASDDDGGSDTATDIARVGFDDIPPEISIVKTADPGTVPETGGDVTFTVEVTNDGDVAITLTSLTDDQFGDLDGKGDCSVPQSLAPAATYTCSFVENLTGTAGDSHINLATATGSDEDGNQVSVSDDAEVNFEDVLPSINVTKTPSFGALLEPGGNVTFTVVVTNDGTVDVTLLSLIDDVFGSLDGRGTCSVGILIEPGQQYTCWFTAEITGPVGTTHINTVTATAEDNDQNPATADDNARVVITDRPFIPVTGGGIKLDRASMLALLYGLGSWFLGLGLVIFGRPQLVRVRRRS
jgi:uncharacterized repeat protein (TIGR01451 family)